MFRRLLMAIVMVAWAAAAQADDGHVKLLWLGQSAFRLTTAAGKTIVIDPWLVTNPKTPPRYKDLDALGKVDLLLVSHGHYDHIADAIPLALKHQAKMYAPGDLNQTLVTLGMIPAELAPRFNKGGTITPFAGVRITATHAEHSSTLVWMNPLTGKDETRPGGEPIGFLIELENGFRIYHMGDTGLFGDMRFIAEYYKPDLVLIPIGGNFTMDPKDAAYAISQFLHPKYAVPMHYGTNPLNKGTPEEFIGALGEAPTKVLTMVPGVEIEF